MIGCRRTPVPDDPVDRTVTPDRLDEVVGEADVVVLSHRPPPGPATWSTPPSWPPCGRTACWSTWARGSLVDEDALLAALDAGTPSAAVLDVFAHRATPSRPPVLDPSDACGSPPTTRPGGFGRLQRQADLFAANLDRWLAGQPLEHDVTDAIKEHHP